MHRFRRFSLVPGPDPLDSSVANPPFRGLVSGTLLHARTVHYGSTPLEISQLRLELFDLDP